MDISSRHGTYETLVNNKFSSQLIISVSGVGDIEKDEMPFESRGSIEEGCPEASSIFVRDTSRSWYTNEDGFDGLIEFLCAFIEQQDVKDVTVYGVSMGACGALLISKHIKANRVVAISPRTLIGESCSYDGRLRDLSEKIKSPRHPDLAKLDYGLTKATIIASIDTPEDAAHASRMVGTGVRVLGARGDHNVAHTMRLKGLLPRLVKSSIDGDIDPDTFGFFELSNDFASAMRMHLIEKVAIESIESLGNVADSQIPHYMLSYLYKRWMRDYITSSPAGSFERIHAYPAHIGQVIEGHSLMPYLSTGWSSPEDFGVWGIGHHHSIRLELIDYKPGENVLIVVYGRVFAHTSVPKIELAGYINGVKCIDSQLGSHTYQFESMITEPRLKIDFFTPNPMSPSEAGIGNDDRELSVAVTKILIEYRPPK